MKQGQNWRINRPICDDAGSGQEINGVYPVMPRPLRKNEIEVMPSKKNTITEIERLVTKDVKPIEGDFSFLKSPRKPSKAWYNERLEGREQ
jgi:hypothetical protein